MGGNYCVVKFLRVYTINGGYRDINLLKEDRYWSIDSIDEDLPDYENKVSEYKKFYLTPQMENITLYDNLKFVLCRYELKYKKLITNVTELSNVVKVVKMESRHEIN